MCDSTVFKGVVHGKIIELDHESGLPDGPQVTATVETAHEREAVAIPPEPEARELYSAIANAPDGVMQWIQNFW